MFNPEELLVEKNGKQSFSIQNFVPVSTPLSKLMLIPFSVVKIHAKSLGYNSVAPLDKIPISDTKGQREAILDTMKQYLLIPKRSSHGVESSHDDKRTKSSASKLDEHMQNLPRDPAHLIAKYALPRSFKGYGGRSRRPSSKRTRQKRRHGRRHTFSKR